ncbi:MAG: hypothetical protein COA78_11955 [Blastopirellula sp.]|nr:MAG: hypothetical protein COA78_11955 [Blastopirellula sp.]
MKPVHNTNASEFGRTYFSEEVTSEQIAETNRAIKSKGNHKLLARRARIEKIKIDKELAEDLGITLKELHQSRLSNEL